MSFDDLFRKDRPNKKLQRTAAGIAVPCQKVSTPGRLPNKTTRMKTGQESSDVLDAAVEDAFPASRLSVENIEGRFALTIAQHGLLRPLGTAELSDGTLRYLLWIAALLTPRPPAVMVLNELETSLHPDLLPALARLIARAAESTQVVVVTHAPPLISALTAQ
jgi:predicted ATPase